jgi:phosphomannomutase
VVAVVQAYWQNILTIIRCSISPYKMAWQISVYFLSYFISMSLSQSIFKAYDIRGIVADELTPNVVKLIGQAIGA